MRSWATWWAVASALLVSFVAHPPLDAQTKPGQAPGTKPSTAKRSRPSPEPSPSLKHTVRPGQTIWSIAREHGVSVDALIRVNRLQPNTKLRVGQRLSLPLSEVPPGSQEPPSLADIVLERPPTTSPVEFIRPVPGTVASPFGPRGRAWHGGMDLRAERGAPIRAAAAGMVITSGWERAYGRVVKIWHFGDLMTVYAHNLENLARVGDWVEQGQVIASVGSTGRATAPHLHFEIRLNGRKYNPAFWLPEPETLEASARSLRSPAAVP
jgi:murein DD-endopeptidase MepM/ murein hydrolase activator NlpD